jgi:hypothetical protein
MKLPTLVQEIAGIIGQRTALALCEANGRQKIYVPLTANPRTKLARMIGITATAKLVEHYPGKLLLLPACKAFTKEKRDSKIKALALGHSTRELSKQFGLTVRQINNIVRG